MTRAQASDVLIVIDMQNDFCPGGPLPVAGGDEIVGPIRRLAEDFEHVICTQDWHPAGHVSFASSHAGGQLYGSVETSYGAQALWPEHCIQGTRGAELLSDLGLAKAELILRKGFRREIDSYSAFLENDHTTATGLAGYLRERGLRRLFFCGLAYDFCVRHSAIDGAALGFECVVVEDVSRAVALAGTVEAADRAFAEAGVARVKSAELKYGS